MPRLSTPRMVPTPSVMFLPGMNVPGGENTLFMPVRAFGAPHTTCTGSPDAGVDHADAQAVGVRMLLGRDHARDGERRQRLRLVVDVLDLEPDHGQAIGELVERLVGLEMIFQPGRE